jgi:hypothetical protein
MLLLEEYILNFMCARYFLYVEFGDSYVNQSLAGQTISQYPNSQQIFHFCCIPGNVREKSKPCCHTLFEVKRT